MAARGPGPPGPHLHQVRAGHGRSGRGNGAGRQSGGSAVGLRQLATACARMGGTCVPAARACTCTDRLLLLPPRLPACRIGQQFSTRVDVLSPEFIKELETLQVWGPHKLTAAATCAALQQPCSSLVAALLCQPCSSLAGECHAATGCAPCTTACCPPVCAQDNVPPFESETAIAIIESSLGKPVGAAAAGLSSMTQQWQWWHAAAPG